MELLWKRFDVMVLALLIVFFSVMLSFFPQQSFFSDAAKQALTALFTLVIPVAVRRSWRNGNGRK